MKACIRALARLCLFVARLFQEDDEPESLEEQQQRRAW